MFHKKSFSFENYKNRLEATQLENNINNIEKNKIDVDNLKEFTKNNQLILKTQQRLENEKHNVFTEEINKMALSLNDDKRVQSIDLIETFDRFSKWKKSD